MKRVGAQNQQTAPADLDGTLIHIEHLKGFGSLKVLLSNFTLARIFGTLLQSIYVCDLEKFKMVFNLIDEEWSKASQ